MRKYKLARREFLGVTGVSLASLAIATMPEMTSGAGNVKTSSQNTPSDLWLLNTGQDDLRAEIYQSALQQRQQMFQSN
jgi:hypothetical protein